MDGLYGQETRQKYLDRWVVDYNSFKNHEPLDGDVPARVATVEVELDEWTDGVRMGDEFKVQERAWESQRKAETKAFRRQNRR